MILEWALPLLATYKYWILFVLFLVEGPVATFFASLLAVSNFFNIWLVIVLAIIGDVLGDIIHYIIGTRITKIKFKEKLKKVETKRMFVEIERLFAKNFYKSLFLIKIIPAFSSVGLLYIGKKRMNFKKYLFGVIIFSTIITFIIAFLGYAIIGSFAKFIYYFDIYQQITYGVIGLLIIGFLIWYFRNNIKNRIYKIVLKSRWPK